MPIVLDPVPDARTHEAVTARRESKRAAYQQIADALIQAAEIGDSNPRRLIDETARQLGVPHTMVAELYWELVRLRIFDQLGRLTASAR